MKLFLPILLLLAAGCSTPTPPPVAAVPVYRTESLILSPDLEFGVDKWMLEVEGRFGVGCLAVVCHGGNWGGQWVAIPLKQFSLVQFRVEWLARALRARNPGRKIILLTCNPGGYLLSGLPGVYYARRSVVFPPFWAIGPARRAAWALDVGSAWEFEEAR